MLRARASPSDWAWAVSVPGTVAISAKRAVGHRSASPPSRSTTPNCWRQWRPEPSSNRMGLRSSTFPIASPQAAASSGGSAGSARNGDFKRVSGRHRSRKLGGKARRTGGREGAAVTPDRGPLDAYVALGKKRRGADREQCRLARVRRTVSDTAEESRISARTKGPVSSGPDYWRMASSARSPSRVTVSKPRSTKETKGDRSRHVDAAP